VNTFTYIDSLDISSEVILYKIKTDLTKDQLINFLHQKAKQYCKVNEIDVENYINYPEDPYYFELIINTMTMYLSLLTCLDKDLLDQKLISKMRCPIIKIKSECLI
jgi:hypothetical protein